jgi:hypothetical protein
MNDVFGGSVFNPVKRSRTGIGGKMEMTHFSNEKIKKISKPNSLIEIIDNMSPLNKLFEMKQMQLRESKVGNLRFCDMWILAKNKIEFQEAMYEDSMRVLNGITRVLEYEVIQDEDGNQGLNLTAILEGQLKNGKLDGYARVMNFVTEICMVGYWTPRINQVENWTSIVQLSKPFGKFCSFYNDGSYKNKEGVYDGWKKFDDVFIFDYLENHKE